MTPDERAAMEKATRDLDAEIAEALSHLPTLSCYVCWQRIGRNRAYTLDGVAHPACVEALDAKWEVENGERG